MGNDAMLTKVRAMLAKAESTPYPEEAKAFTAKAQELMIRHAIDEAQLGDVMGDPMTEMVTQVVIIHKPFAMAKGTLLNVVALENRCYLVRMEKTRNGKDETIWHLFGRRRDVEYVETVFTSLLLQAQSEMVKVECDNENDGVEMGNMKTWRNTFLHGYASGIHKRIKDVNRKVVQESDDPGMAVVLADQKRQAEDYGRDKVGFVRKSSASYRMHEGAASAGRDAANRASIHKGAMSGRKALG